MGKKAKSKKNAMKVRLGGTKSTETVPFEFVEVKFSKDDLQKLPRHELEFLIASGLASNDLAIFARIQTMLSHKNSKDETVAKIAVVNYLIIRRHLLSKIVEFVKLIGDLEKICERKKSAVKFQSLFDLACEIKKQPMFEFACGIRNNLTHHYSSHHVFKSLDGFPADNSYSILQNQISGNSISFLAEEIAHLSRLESIVATDDAIRPSAGNETNKADGIDHSTVEPWIVETGKALMRGYERWVLELVRRHFPDRKFNRSQHIVERRYVGQMTDTTPILLEV